MNTLSVFRTEKYAYFFIWIVAVLYSLYCFGSTSYLYFQNYRDNYNDFTRGFFFLSHKRDKSDFEWEAISYLIKEFYPWIFVYIILSEFVHNFLELSTRMFQVLQICFALLCMLSQVGHFMVFLILLQPIIFYIICNFYRNTFITWLCTGVSLFFITQCKKIYSEEDFVKHLNLSYQELYFAILCLFWMNLKCSSYFLEKQSSTRFLDFFSYCLYLPVIFTGPFIPYKDYFKIYNVTTLPLQKRVKKLIFNLANCLFWYLFTNVFLHYLYVNATSYQLKLVRSFDNWSLYGYGYAMGQFFHIKYLVLYGLSTSFASFEGVDVPHLPRCIGRIHLYSDMWKYFDPGLYNFLVRYIYIPLCNIVHYKLIASFICFLFIYLWHGVEHYILMWTILNYIGIIFEYGSSLLFKKYFENDYAERMDTGWLRRLKCILASPLLVMSAISNFYFFAGVDVGYIFARRIFEGILCLQTVPFSSEIRGFSGTIKDSLIKNTVLLLVLYCCCQVSTELQNVSARKM